MSFEDHIWKVWTCGCDRSKIWKMRLGFVQEESKETSSVKGKRAQRADVQCVLVCHVTRHYLKKKSLYVYAVYVSCLCRQPGFVSFNASIRLECSSLQTSHIHLLNLKPIYSPLKLHTLHIHLRICLANFWVSQIWKNMQFDKEKVELRGVCENVAENYLIKFIIILVYCVVTKWKCRIHEIYRACDTPYIKSCIRHWAPYVLIN